MAQVQEFSHLDEIAVRVAFGPYPHQPPDEVFLLGINQPDLGGEPWSDDDLVAALEPVSRLGGGYELRVSKTHFSWGADGAGAQILLYVANHALGGVIDAAAATIVFKARRAVRSKVATKWCDTAPFTPTPEELTELGKMHVRSAFQDWLSNDASLELVHETREADGSCESVYVDEEQYSYRVAFRAGEVSAIRVTRIAPSD